MINLNKKGFLADACNEVIPESSAASSICDLFWQQVQMQPDSIAVVADDYSLTYKELAKNCTDLAVYLRYLGVKLDDLVGIFVEPSIELIIIIWGTLIAGAAYLPLAPEYPEERLKYMLNDSKAKFIITQKKLQNKLAAFASQDVQIITLDELIKLQRSNIEIFRFRNKVDIQPSNLAYVIYTSGSTGKPKGVMIEHRSIINQMCWLKNTFNLNNQTTILQKTPMSFDAAQWEILAVSCGSKVIMGSPGIHKNPEQLIKTIRKHNVTALQCVPTLLQTLLDTDEFHHCKTLSHIFSGGEALTKNLALECTSLLPKCHLINLYGPTECTINTSAFVVNAKTIKKSHKTIAIGKPISGIQYYILNNTKKLVSTDETGELYIGGIGLARGYLRRPELTAEKFVNIAFCANEQPTRLYRTGDLVHWNSDGTVQYVGRADNQVKLRGFRVELDEIKAAIATHAWIKHAAVIVKNDTYTGYQNLIAFIELNPKEAALMDRGFKCEVQFPCVHMIC